MKKLTFNTNKPKNQQLELVNDHSDSLDFLNDRQYHLNAKSGRLVLSSSVGSVVALSSNLYFPVDAPTSGAHITANNSHLLLSSSVGSKVVVSGNLHIVNKNPWILFVESDPATPQQTRHIMLVSFRNQLQFQNRNDIGTSALSVPIRIDMTTGSIDFAQTGSYHIQAINDRLILSSSSKSAVAISGSLYVETTNGAFLPPRLTNAQKDALTPAAGMVIYNSTSGSLNLYTTAWKIISVT